MEEEEPLVTPTKPSTKPNKCFSHIQSTYSLRKTPARSLSKPTTSPTPQHGSETPKSLPRRYPSRVRVSAVKNSPPSPNPKDSSVDLDGNGEESESRKRVKQILDGFRQVYDELAEQEKKIGSKASGETLRLSNTAYNLYRERNKDLGGVVRSLGGIPGVEIGDEFKFMFELFLLGLHCQLKYVDYIKQGERVVSVSIVSVYDLGEKMRKNGDVLVFCGGKNNKKDRGGFGVLALKNNMDDKIPIRVVLGFRHTSREMTYVYGGLYLIESSWIKRDKHEGRVMFRSRRLPEQAKLDIVGVMKSIRSREKSDMNKEKDSLPSKCTTQKVHPSIGSNEGMQLLGKRARVEEEKEEEVISQAEGRKRVKQTLHEFHSIYENLAEEYEVKHRGEPKKKKEAGDRARFDLDAYKLLREKKKDMSNMSKRVGGIPGIEVGDKFYYRVELSLLGVHNQLQSDIDYVRIDERLLAVSIVSMRLGMYNGNASNLNVLLFCGSGMKNRDQKMVNGNLALKSSIDAKTPVRVVHGFKNAKKNAIYFYFGLYSVEKYWRKKDNDGHNVFMFRLRRLPGQPNLDIKNPKKSIGLRSHISSNHILDISQGKEKVPIRVVNTVNDEKLPPFNYRTAVIYPPNYNLIPLEGCNCVDGCTDSDACACAVRNGGELPFNSKGEIVEAKPLIYQCGPFCKCPPSCHNRVGQQGMKIPLEIFKTKTMGWGVRSPVFIPSGSFICEYVGELLEDEEAQKRSTDEYLFAIGNNYYDESLWEGLSSIPCLQKNTSNEAVEDGGFTVDASKYGNIGKFINHNCTPNLYAQNLLYDHDDKRMPHVMFFACEDIPPMQELFYHYNYTIDDVHDSNGNIRKKNCYCGSIECTGRLY